MFSPKIGRSALLVCSAVLMTLTGGVNLAQAASFSFRGTFDKDDDVQLFNFTVGSASTVTLKSLSYAGGTQSDGTVISRGGFDPILSLFDGAGSLIDFNDDGHSDRVGIDSVTGRHFDTFLQAALNPGTYTVAVSQFNNASLGTLSAGFTYRNQPNFTARYNCSAGIFCDTGRDSRTNEWAFDIIDVDRANITNATVPEPATILGIITSGAVLGRKLSKNGKYTKKRNLG